MGTLKLVQVSSFCSQIRRDNLLEADPTSAKSTTDTDTQPMSHGHPNLALGLRKIHLIVTPHLILPYFPNQSLHNGYTINPIQIILTVNNKRFFFWA